MGIPTSSNEVIKSRLVNLFSVLIMYVDLQTTIAFCERLVFNVMYLSFAVGVYNAR